MYYKDLRQSIDESIDNGEVPWFFGARGNGKVLPSLKLNIIFYLRLNGFNWDEVEEFLKGIEC